LTSETAAAPPLQAISEAKQRARTGGHRSGGQVMFPVG